MSFAYIVRRLALMVLTLLASSMVVFVLIRIIPGDVVTTMAIQGSLTADQEALLRRELGLDLPIMVQYFHWVKGAVQGDLGLSLRYKVPVADMLSSAFPRTLVLAFWGIILALAFTLPLVIFATLFPEGPGNYLVTGWTVVSISVPSLSIGIGMLLLFAVQLQWLPAISHPVLPVMVIAFGTAGVLMRTLRNSIFSDLSSDYARTARSKGIQEWRVRLRHVIPNVIATFVTLVALSLAEILTGATVIETLFAWPGVGMLVVDAIKARDYPVVQGTVMLFALIFNLVNLATDILYTLLDPRIRLEPLNS